MNAYNGIKKMNNTEKINLDGTHLMLDCFGCDANTLSNKQIITDFLANLPKLLGMHRLIDPIVIEYTGGDTWDKGGITGMVFIAESHVSIHTFPCDGFYTADVYSCKPFDCELAISIFKNTFHQTSQKINVVKRDIVVVREKNLQKLGLLK